MGSGERSAVAWFGPWSFITVGAVMVACGSSKHGDDDDRSPSGKGGAVSGASSVGGSAGSTNGGGGASGGRAGALGTAGAAGSLRGGSGGNGGSTAGRGGAPAGGAGTGGTAGVSGNPQAGEAGEPMLPPFPEGWSEPLDFPIPEDHSARPNVTIESTGLAHVSALAQELWVTTYDAEGKLGTPVVLEGEHFTHHAAFGIDRNDVSIAVWPGPVTGNRSDELMASRHPPGGSWSAPVSVGTGFPDVDELSLAVSTNGTAVAVWIIPYGAVRYAHFDGAAWSSPSDIAPLMANSLALPSVSLDASGKGLAVWRDVMPADVIGASRFDGTTFGAPTDLCPESATECYLPAVAMRGDGSGMAAFELDYTLNGIEYDLTQGWQSPAPISVLDRADYGAAPKLAYNQSNDLIAIWREEIDDYDFRCLGAVTTGTSTGPTWTRTQLQTEAGETGTKALAVAPDGRAIVIWASAGSGTTPSRFWAAYYTPPDGWAPAFVLDEGGADAGAAEVAAAINDHGQAVVAWTHWESPPHVRVARFDPP